MGEVEFGMRILKYTQNSFERQIRESVVIQDERTRHKILNSRTEYNRCSLPRLYTQIGDEAFKEYGTDLAKEKLEEDKIEYKKRQLRMQRNRQDYTQRENKAQPKRRGEQTKKSKYQ